jgi:hypothetical protein
VLAHGTFYTIGAASALTMIFAASFVVAAGSQLSSRPEAAEVRVT